MTATAAIVLLAACARSDDGRGRCAALDTSAKASYQIALTNVEPPCAIHFDRHFALRTSEVNVSDYSAPMVLLPSGELLTRSSVRERLSIWTADGSPHRFIGREGSGPGEFRHVAAVYRDESDTVHVADNPGRWHVYTPDLEYVRTNLQLLDGWNDTAFLENGQVITGRNAGYPEGYLFFILDRDGKIARSFGQAMHHNDNRRIAYEGDGSFWTASPTRYRLERWNVKGEQLASITRDVEWFRPSDTGAAWHPATFQPVITRLIHDEGYLWVVSVIPVKDEMTTSLSEAWDWVVEVFDTSTGALLASERHDSPEAVPVGRLHDGRFYTLLTLDNGTYSAAVGDFSLTDSR